MSAIKRHKVNLQALLEDLQSTNPLEELRAFHQKVMSYPDEEVQEIENANPSLTY